jgi:hypothetical protein
LKFIQDFSLFRVQFRQVWCICIEYQGISLNYLKQLSQYTLGSIFLKCSKKSIIFHKFALLFIPDQVSLIIWWIVESLSSSRYESECWTLMRPSLMPLIGILEVLHLYKPSEIFRHKTSHMVLSNIFLEDKHNILLHLSIFYEYQQFWFKTH